MVGLGLPLSFLLAIRITAAALGYRPASRRTCRSSNRSLVLNARIRLVTSPMSERAMINAPSSLKCSAQWSNRGWKNRT